ncbi:MAG: hypothetical protein JWR16_1719 [Nevskia sp.]|nr:hypothetical protein [Nevskia sp.]
MNKPLKILLQTTIPTPADDWGIARFSRLAALLAGATDASGATLFDVTARDRDALGVPDPILSQLETSDFDELWLFAVDTGDGLTAADCEAISRFRQRGGGLLVTRDHMNLGCSVCTLGGVGAAHFFHSKNPDPDVSRHVIDDPYTTRILWPNYHSGANGDFQSVWAAEPVHPVLVDPMSASGIVAFLPAHPHEGAVGKPAADASARVIATGVSAVTGTRFNLAVAFEPSDAGGPAIAESTFHHFADYNWDPAAGAPSFVSEPPGNGLASAPGAMRSVERYMRNLALWLGGRSTAAETTIERSDRALDEALDESFPASDPPAIH